MQQIKTIKRLTILISLIIGLSSCQQDLVFENFNNPKVWEESQTTPNSIYNGVEYILKGFEQFDLVAIGESHGIREVTDFYIELVNNENFRRHVDAIVFELGNSLYQEDLDDYILGITNDTLSIKKLWRDHSSSFLQSGDRSGVSRFFKEVRQINQSSEHKIRILAAEPPIEWARIKNTKDVFKYIDQRDQFYADVVVGEVINKEQKALLIMGSQHFNKCKPPHRKADNPLSAIRRATHKNMVLITTMTSDKLPFDQLPNINKGDVIETVNPIIGELTIENSSNNDCPLKFQTDALLYLGNMSNLSYEEQTPFNDHHYEKELKRRMDLVKLSQ